jgi:hypothetical protein
VRLSRMDVRERYEWYAKWGQTDSEGKSISNLGGARSVMDGRVLWQLLCVLCARHSTPPIEATGDIGERCTICEPCIVHERSSTRCARRGSWNSLYNTLRMPVLDIMDLALPERRRELCRMERGCDVRKVRAQLGDHLNAAPIPERCAD